MDLKKEKKFKDGVRKYMKENEYKKAEIYNDLDLYYIIFPYPIHHPETGGWDEIQFWNIEKECPDPDALNYDPEWIEDKLEFVGEITF